MEEMLVNGGRTMTAGELAKKIYEAGFPETVVLHPLDFMALCKEGGVQSPPRTPEGRAFVYIGNTRVECAVPEAGTRLDLSNRQPEMVVLAKSVRDAGIKSPLAG